MASEFQHAGISVADLERSIAWYVGHFGFRVMKRFRKDELEIDGAVLELGGSTLEVLAPFSPLPPAQPATTLVEQLRRTGMNHIALSVDDPSVCRERLKNAGAAMVGPMVDGRFFFCADPDGIVLEIRGR